MAGSSFNYDFTARVTGDISDVRKQLNILKSELGKLEIPKKTADGFLNNLKKVEGKLEDFEAKAAKGIANKNDMRSIISAYGQLTDSIRKAGFAMDRISELDNLFDPATSKKIQEASKAIKEYDASLKKLKADEDVSKKQKKIEADRKALNNRRKNYDDDIKNLQEREANYKKDRANWNSSVKRKQYDSANSDKESWAQELQKEKADLEKAEKDLENFKQKHSNFFDLEGKKLSSEFNNQRKDLQKEIDRGSPDAIKKKRTELTNALKEQQRLDDIVAQANDEVAKAKNNLSSSDIRGKRKKTLEEQEEVTQLEQAVRDANTRRSLADSNTRGQAKEVNRIQKELKDLESIDVSGLTKKLAPLEKIKDKYDTLLSTIRQNRKKVSDLENDDRAKGPAKKIVQEKEKLDTEKQAIADEKKRLNREEQTLEEKEKEQSKQEEDFKKQKKEYVSESTKGVKNAFKGLGLENEAESALDDIQKLWDLLQKFKEESASNKPEALANLIKGFEDLSKSADKVGDGVNEAGDALTTFTEKQKDVDRMKQSVLDFFSVGNTIRLFKRAVRDAFSTVKDLDKAMTETAVVTDYSIEDMWKKLPEYTKLANELGTTTQGAYETMTLFYQQGLKSDQAFEVGTETMKMARIANMDYAHATNLMTAALRGFNMELNQESAQRINDVYSELAAVTAADTSEIATAMTKTASIANSANMEFETTAALLTQIIETTRESPETAGTALKTVIARFQELTKAPGELVEVDGEKIDANKIEHALRTVGVTLRDNVTGQFRDLDDVFLELAGKWDTLDTNTQRYIATIAAGSRQQSRFLAMMSNFERTQELIDSAQNSEGAGQAQFEKTLDSLDSKLNKLHNAWDEFAMGLADSSTIKYGTDALTVLLDKINKLTNLGEKDEGILAPLTSHFSEISKIVLAITAVKLGRGLFQGFTGDKGFLGALKDEYPIFQNMRKTILDQKKDQLETNEILATQLGLTQKLGHSTLKMFGATKLAGSGLATAAVGGLEVVAAIVAFAAIMAGLKYQRDNYTLNGQIEKLQEASKGLASDAEEVESAYKSVSKTIDSLGDRFTQITKLAKGTEEWKEAVTETNGELFKMVDTIPELASALTFKNGVGTLDFDKAEQVMSDYKVRSGILERASQLSEQQLFDKQLEKRNAELFKKEVGWQQFNPFYRWTRQVKGNSVQEDITSDWLKNYFGESGKFSFIKSLFKNLELRNYKQGITPDYSEERIHMAEEEKSPGMLYTSVKRDSKKVEEEAQQYAEENGKSPSEKALYRDLYMRNALLAADYAALPELSEDLAKKLVSGEILEWGSKNSLSGSEYDIAKTWLKEQDSNVKELTMGDYIALKQQGKEYQKREDSINLQNQKAVSALQEEIAFSSERNKEAVGNLSDALTSDIYQKQKEKALDYYNKQEIGDTQRQAYATMMGWFHLKGNTFVDDQGNEKTASDEMVRYGLASQKADEDYKSYGAKLDALFSTMTDKQVKNFTELFSEDGLQLTTKTLKEFNKVGIFEGELRGEDATGEIVTKAINGLNLDSVTEALTGKNLQKLAEATDMDPKKLGQQIVDNINAANERINDQRLDISKDMVATGTVSSITQAAERLKRWEESGRDPDEFRDAYQGMLKSFGNVGDYDLSRSIFETINSKIDKGLSNKELAKLNAFGTTLNFDDPLGTMKQLKSAARDSSSEVGKLAQQIIDFQSPVLSGAAQFRSLLRSTSFDDISEDIADIVKENGELDSGDVLALADDYESLGQILDETSMSAEGLAAALSAISSGDIGIDELTDTVVAALGAFETLDSLVGNTLHDIEKFDPGLDEGEAAGFISDAYDTMNDQLEKGAYGNSQLRNYMSHLFGQDWAQGLNAEQQISQMKAARDKLESNTAFMKDIWQNVVNGQDFWGNETTQSAFNKMGLSVTEENGRILITEQDNGKGNLTTENLVKGLTSQLGISEAFAQLLITDFKNYSDSDMLSVLNGNDKQQALDNAYDAAFKAGYMDRREAETMDKLFGWDQNTALEGMVDRNNTKGAPVVFTDFYENGALKETAELLKEVNRASQAREGQNFASRFRTNAVPEEQWVKESWATRTEGLASMTAKIPDTFKYDYDAMTTELQKMGLEGQAAADVIQASMTQAAQESGKAIELSYTDAFNNTKKLTFEAGKNIQEEIAIENQKAAWTEQANIIKSVFGTIELKFDSPDVQTIASQLDGAAAQTRSLSFDSGNLDAILAEVPTVINISLNAKKTGEWPTGAEGGDGGGNSNISAITFSSQASGIVNSPRTFNSLTGEEGPELVWSGDKSYLVGTDGPQMATIKKGDTVYTAAQTKKILSNRKIKKFGSFSGGQQIGGYTDATDTSKKKKDGGGAQVSKDKEEKPWENPFDALYNLIRQIDEEMRERNRIERAYQKELKEINLNAKTLAENTKAQIEQMLFEKTANEARIERREEQLRKYQKKNSAYNEYASVGEDGKLRIDWLKINKVKDSEEGKNIEEYVKQLEEWTGDINDAKDAIYDIEDQIEDLKEARKEAYLDFENRVKEALITNRQAEIDELTKINESVNDSNSKIISAMEKSISKMRQDRENEKTEKELGEKYRQLAYLQQDTSGANDLDVFNRQEELKEAEESYTDELVDQRIQQLQDQNELAAEQREMQISILQTQLEIYEQSGKVFEDVKSLLESGVGPNGDIVKNSSLVEVLKKADNWKGMSEEMKADWDQKYKSELGQTFDYITNKDGAFRDDIKKIVDTIYKPKKVGKKNSGGGEGSSGGGGGGDSGESNAFDAWYKGYIEEQSKKQIEEQKANRGKNPYTAGTREWVEWNAGARFATGGLADFTGPAWLDGTKSHPELVLNAKDTQNFIQLKDILGSFLNGGTSFSSQNSGDTSYDIDINVEKISDDYDVEQIADKVKRLINTDARYRNNNTIGSLR